MNMQCDNVVEERRPDIVILNKMEKTAITTYVAIHGRQKNNWQRKGEDWEVSESRKRDSETLKPQEN